MRDVACTGRCRAAASPGRGTGASVRRVGTPATTPATRWGTRSTAMRVISANAAWSDAVRLRLAWSRQANPLGGQTHSIRDRSPDHRKRPRDGGPFPMSQGSGHRASLRHPSFEDLGVDPSPAALAEDGARSIRGCVHVAAALAPPSPGHVHLRYPSERSDSTFAIRRWHPPRSSAGAHPTLGLRRLNALTLGRGGVGRRTGRLATGIRPIAPIRASLAALLSRVIRRNALRSRWRGPSWRNPWSCWPLSGARSIGTRSTDWVSCRKGRWRSTRCHEVWGHEFTTTNGVLRARLAEPARGGMRASGAPGPLSAPAARARVTGAARGRPATCSADSRRGSTPRRKHFCRRPSVYVGMAAISGFSTGPGEIGVASDRCVDRARLTAEGIRLQAVGRGDGSSWFTSDKNRSRMHDTEEGARSSRRSLQGSIGPATAGRAQTRKAVHAASGAADRARSALRRA
jgi:hypothetical protein